jgi:SAM-dependent methyltransferase
MNMKPSQTVDLGRVPKALRPEIKRTAMYKRHADVLTRIPRYNIRMLSGAYAQRQWDERSLGLQKDLEANYHGGPLLDVCCGIGQNLYVAIKRGLVRSDDAYGVDIVKAQVETWKMHFSEVFREEGLVFPPIANVRHGDALDLKTVFGKDLRCPEAGCMLSLLKPAVR